MAFPSPSLLKTIAPLLVIAVVPSCTTMPETNTAVRKFVAPIDFERRWPVTSVVINGEPLRFIVDTAAGGSVIDAAIAHRLQLPSSGAGQVAGATSQGAVNNVRAPRLEVGGAVHANHEMVLTDMSQLGANFGGILGNDVFRHYSFVLDVPGRRLELTNASRPDLGRGMRCVPNARPQRPESIEGFALVEASIRAEGSDRAVPIIAVIDSGAQRTILNWSAANALGLRPDDPRLTERRSPTGINATSRSPSAYAFRLVGLDLAGWRVPPADIRISDLPILEVLGLATTPAMILGADILSQRVFGIGKGATSFCLGNAPAA